MPNRTATPDVDDAAPRTNELRENLRIDEDDIDRCLVQQPDYFFQAADAFALANSQRDTIKLQLKELIAQLDQDLRKKALDDQERISEAQLTNRITTLPKVKELNQKLLQAARIADRCEALKESYIQRSHALRDLNSSAIARQYNLGIERGAGAARNRIVDRSREDIDREREASGVFNERRATASKDNARYRPRDQGD